MAAHTYTYLYRREARGEVGGEGLEEKEGAERLVVRGRGGAQVLVVGRC